MDGSDTEIQPVKRKGGRPKGSGKNDPVVFQAAVDAAVESRMASLLEQIRTERNAPVSSAPSSVNEGDMNLARHLALAIAEISDQGTNRKRVAPEVLASREQARKKMFDLIIKARAEERIPVYMLKSKVYLDEVLVDPIWVGADHVQRPTEIEWPGVPSEAMRPKNEAASEIFDAFIASIGSIVKAVDEGDMKVTAGGLTIIGKPKPRSPGQGDALDTGLKVIRRGAPETGKTINVLGTIAAPARQTA